MKRENYRRYGFGGPKKITEPQWVKDLPKDDSEWTPEQDMAYRCEYPISLSPEKESVIDIVLPDDQQFFNLHLAVSHNVNLDFIKALSNERTIKPSKIELDRKTLDIFRNGDTDDIYGFAVHMNDSKVSTNLISCFAVSYGGAWNEPKM